MRNPGLDVARSLAIVLVLIAHFSTFFRGTLNIDPVLIGAGYFGVELFFVLSGFLIGRILIRDVLPEPSFGALTAFWKRRWFRTLPAYYLVWMGLFVLTGSWPNVAPHLFFLQNWFAIPRDTFFGVSWSLVIEEWFYLTVPLWLIALRAKLNARDAVLVLCLLGIVLCPLGRWVNQDLTWMDIRKGVFIRMDAILFGLLLAWISIYAKSVLPKLARLAIPSLIGLVALASAFFDGSILETVFCKTVYFSLVSLLMLPIIAALYQARFSTKVAEPSAFVSITSYSVYLIHWEFMQLFRHFNPFKDSIALTLLVMVLCTAAIYGAAYLMYRFWERPWLALRENRKASVPAV